GAPRTGPAPHPATGPAPPGRPPSGPRRPPPRPAGPHAPTHPPVAPAPPAASPPAAHGTSPPTLLLPRPTVTAKAPAPAGPAASPARASRSRAAGSVSASRARYISGYLTSPQPKDQREGTGPRRAGPFHSRSQGAAPRCALHPSLRPEVDRQRNPHRHLLVP